MRIARIAAFGVALVSVGLMVTPASARSVTRFTGKDTIAFVTNCKFDHVGERCLVYGIFAFKQRVNSDGSVSSFASLELDKYRIKVLDTAGDVDVTFVAAGLGQNVQLNIADDLSNAHGSGTVGNVVGGRIKVSFNVTASSPLFTSKSRQVIKIGNCRAVIDRSNGKSRSLVTGTSDQANAIIDGKSYAWTDLLAVGGAPIPTIDTAAETTIFNDCPV